MSSKFWKSILDEHKFQLKEGYPEFSFGTIIVICLCIILLIIATFTKFDLFVLNFFSPYDVYRGENSSFFSYFTYIPQVPVVFFIAALLGPVNAMIVIFIYIVAGILGVPLFSSGGGLAYLLKPGFGYLLGFFPAVFFVSNIIKHREKKYRYLKATIAGLICVHLTGTIYLSVLMFFQGEQLFLILSWFWLFSAMQLFYDFVFGLLAIILGRVARNFFAYITD